MDEIARAAALSIVEKWGKMDQAEKQEPEKLTGLIQEVLTGFDFSTSEVKKLNNKIHQILLDQRDSESHPVLDELTKACEEIHSKFSLKKFLFKKATKSVDPDILHQLAPRLQNFTSSQIKTYKELSKNIGDEGGKLEITAAIPLLPEEHLKERIKLCKKLSKGVKEGVSQAKIIEEVAKIPVVHFDERAKQCKKICKDLGDKQKLMALETLASLPDDHFEERSDLIKALLKRATHQFTIRLEAYTMTEGAARLPDDHRIRALQAVAKVPNELFDDKVEFFQKTSEGIQDIEEILDVLEAVSLMPEKVLNASKALNENFPTSGSTGILGMMSQLSMEKFDFLEKLYPNYTHSLKTTIPFLEQILEIPEQRFQKTLELVEQTFDGRAINSMRTRERITLLKAINQTPEDQLDNSLDLMKDLGKHMGMEKKVQLMAVARHIPIGEYEVKRGLIKEMWEKAPGDKQISFINMVAKMPNDTHLPNRATLYLHLLPELLNPEQEQLFREQLARFTPSSERGNGEDLTNEFLEHLETRLTDGSLYESISEQDFLRSFRNNTASWIPQHLMLLANEAFNAREDHTLSPTGVVHVKTSRERLEENPEGELLKLLHSWKTSPMKDLRLSVSFKGQNEQVEAGVDAGGLSREYLQLLSKGLCDKHHLRELTLRPGKEEQGRKILEGLGNLFMACFYSVDSDEHFSQKLLTGRLFPVELFTAVTKLNARECLLPLEEVPVEKRVEVTRLLSPARLKENQDRSAVEKLLFKTKEEIVPEDRDVLTQHLLLSRGLESIDSGMADEEDKMDHEKLTNAFSRFLDDNTNDEHYQDLMTVVMDLFLPQHFSFAQSLAKGMMESCALEKSTDGQKKHWNDLLSKFSPEMISDDIQGKIERGAIAEAIECKSNSSGLREKTGYLKEWVENASEEKLKQFLQILTGSSGLPGGRQILVSKIEKKDISCEFHTCAYQVDLRSDFWEVDLLSPRPSSPTKEDRKRAFMQQFELEIQSNSGVFTSE